MHTARDLTTKDNTAPGGSAGATEEQKNVIRFEWRTPGSQLSHELGTCLRAHTHTKRTAERTWQRVRRKKKKERTHRKPAPQNNELLTFLGCFLLLRGMTQKSKDKKLRFQDSPRRVCFVIERNYISVLSVFFLFWMTQKQSNLRNDVIKIEIDVCFEIWQILSMYVCACQRLIVWRKVDFFITFFFTFSQMFSSLRWTANSAAFSKHGLAFGVLSSFVV